MVAQFPLTAHRKNCRCPGCEAAEAAYDREQNDFRTENLDKRRHLNPGQIAPTYGSDRVPQDAVYVPKDGADFGSMTERQAAKVMGCILKISFVHYLDSFSALRLLRLFEKSYPQEADAMYKTLQFDEKMTDRPMTNKEAGDSMMPAVSEATIRRWVTNGRFFLHGVIEGMGYGEMVQVDDE